MFEAPYQPRSDVDERKEAYCLKAGVDRMIEMTDHMIRYKAEKDEQEKRRRANMSEKERQMQMNIVEEPVIALQKKQIGSPEKSMFERSQESIGRGG